LEAEVRKQEARVEKVERKLLEAEDSDFLAAKRAERSRPPPS
jgi:hypothetical protein